VYVIAILDFVFEEDKHNIEKYRYDVKLTDIETNKVFFDKLTFIYLEMPKFNKTIDELETRFEKWMFVIRNLERLDHLPDKLREKIFEKIFAAAEVAKFSRKEYCNYARDFGKMSYDYHSYNYRIDKATKEALAEGLAEGLEKGMEKGREKEKIKIVLNSHKEGFSIPVIAKITGLTSDKIVELLQQQNLKN
jgi:predicted transposase/invertase (TIGR01784 family)